MLPEYIRRVNDRFYVALQRKTGWGKDEVYKLYLEICTEITAELCAETEAKVIDG